MIESNGDQMRAAILAERERSARVCEAMEPLAGATVHDIARAIRSGVSASGPDATSPTPLEELRRVAQVTGIPLVKLVADCNAMSAAYGKKVQP